jgi:hypothetical protein
MKAIVPDFKSNNSKFEKLDAQKNKSSQRSLTT